MLERRQHCKKGCGERGLSAQLWDKEKCTQNNTQPTKLPACEGEPLRSAAHMKQQPDKKTKQKQIKTAANVVQGSQDQSQADS